MKTSGDIDLTEGHCFRATPLFSRGNYLTLRTIHQEKTKEHLEDILDDFFTPNSLLPPRKKPSFKPGDWWALRSKDASWERVQVCKEPWKKPIDCTVGNGVVVDRHDLEVKLHRSDPDLQKIPNDKVHLITVIPPICYTVIVDPTFKPNIQLVGSLPDLVRAGTEIMCM
uniref:Uncharacterized protein n=1 Tax=Plectus sambesii TaxID=2011161 RepID=A0A914WRC3_9BILA